MDQFLVELTELSKKYNMIIQSKYPEYEDMDLIDISTSRIIAGDLEWDDEYRMYKASKV